MSPRAQPFPASLTSCPTSFVRGTYFPLARCSLPPASYIGISVLSSITLCATRSSAAVCPCQGSLDSQGPQRSSVHLPPPPHARNWNPFPSIPAQGYPGPTAFLQGQAAYRPPDGLAACRAALRGPGHFQKGGTHPRLLAVVLSACFICTLPSASKSRAHGMCFLGVPRATCSLDTLDVQDMSFACSPAGGRTRAPVPMPLAATGVGADLETFSSFQLRIASCPSPFLELALPSGVPGARRMPFPWDSPSDVSEQPSHSLQVRCRIASSHPASGLGFVAQEPPTPLQVTHGSLPVSVSVHGCGPSGHGLSRASGRPGALAALLTPLPHVLLSPPGEPGPEQPHPLSIPRAQST